MTGYHVSVALATARLVAGAALAFVLVPRLVLGDRWSAPARAAAAVVYLSFAVPILAVLRVFDTFSLVTAAVVPIAVRHRGHVREAVRRAWTVAAAAVLEAVESPAPFARIRSGADRGRRALRTALRGESMLPRLAGPAVVGAALVVHLTDAWRHAADDQSGGAALVSELQALGVRRLWPDGVRPTGPIAVLGTLQRAATVDASLLVRLAPGLATVAVVALTVWAGRRVGGSRAAGPVAGLLVLALAGRVWPTYLTPAGDALAVTLASGTAVAAVALTGGVMSKRRGGPWPLWCAVAATAALAPVVGAALLAALAVTWIIHRATDDEPTAPVGVLLGSSAAVLVGVLPIAVGTLAGRGRYTGPGDIVSQLGQNLRLAPQVPEPWAGPPAALVVAVVLAALVLVVPRRRLVVAPLSRSAAIVALAMVAASMPSRFALPALIAPGAAARVAVPLVAVAASTGLLSLLPRRWPSMTLVAGAAAAALVVVSSPLPLPGDRSLPDDVVEALYRIKDTRRPYDWTVVDLAGSAGQVRGYGSFLTVDEFVRRYDPVRFAFDPDRRSLAPPTRSVFVFVRRRDLRAEVVEQDAAGAGVAVGAAPAEAAAMRRWLGRYERVHGRALRFEQTPGLLVAEIRRRPEEDEHFRRGGRVCIPQPAHHLLLPTPREFESC